MQQAFAEAIVGLGLRSVELLQPILVFTMARFAAQQLTDNREIASHQRTKSAMWKLA